MPKSVPEPLPKMQTRISRMLTEIVDAEKWSGVLLVVCTLVSLALANSTLGPAYLRTWHTELGGMRLDHWINDALMAVFFLFIGLELESELKTGTLASFRTALLPVLAAAGGVCVPALIHFACNAGTPTQVGAGIPMATDIAFALGALALLDKRIPASLRVLLVALAVLDDLAAILVIAIFYTAHVSLPYLAGAAAVFCMLLMLNYVFGVRALVPYLLGGVAMWLLMQRSGVHATMSGVLLAFAIPFSPRQGERRSPSSWLEHFLHRPVAWMILPLFTLANTGIQIRPGWYHALSSANSVGIFSGLVIGKPLGVCLASAAGIALGICRLPPDLNWRHLVGAGLLAGIGFTMSIFVTNLAFGGNGALVDASRIAIMLASLTAGMLGCVWLGLGRDRLVG